MSNVINLPGSNNQHTIGRPIDPWDRQYNGYTGEGIDSDSPSESGSDLEDFIEDDSYSSEDEDYVPDEEEQVEKKEEVEEAVYQPNILEYLDNYESSSEEDDEDDEDFNPDEEETLLQLFDEISNDIEVLEDNLPVSVTCTQLFTDLNSKISYFRCKLSQ